MAVVGIHIPDAMTAVTGPATRVLALSRRVEVGTQLDDATSVMFEFASGAMGTLSILTATTPFWWLHVFGSSGWAQMPDQYRLIRTELDGNLSEQSFEPLDTLAAEGDAFALTVQEGRAWPVTPAQAFQCRGDGGDHAFRGQRRRLCRSGAGLNREEPQPAPRPFPVTSPPR